MIRPQQSARAGTVLVIVIGILAVLMIMAATLALLSRVELKASDNYQAGQMLDQLVQAMQTYAVGILHQDKFGSDGVPYDYEKLAVKYATPPPPLPEIYPTRSAGDGLSGDDENFDSDKAEEWMPGPEAWRLWPGPLGELPPPTSADSILNRSGGLLRGEFALYFVDLGGARIDINNTGNVAGSGQTHFQSQGLTPFESSPAAVITARGGNGPVGARELISSRHGADGQPGTASTNDSDLLGPLAGWTPALDVNLDGIIDAAAVTDEPTEYIAEYPVGDDRPFGPTDMHDLFWGVDTGSRAANILLDLAKGNLGDPQDNLPYFTTASGGTIIAGRAIRGGQSVFDSTNPVTIVQNLANYPFLNYGALLRSPTSEGELVLQRAIQDGIAGLAGTPQQKADQLSQFLWALGPVVRYADGSLLNPADTRIITRQVAVNLIDMLDTDSMVTAWTWTDAVSGNTYDFYGVEPMPYIAEVEASVKTSLHPYVPEPSGKIGVPFPGASYIGELRTPGSPPPGVPNEPATGWGKYIKLVNPWNVPIALDNWRVVIDGGKCWTFDQPANMVDDDNDGVPDEGWDAAPRSIKLPLPVDIPDTYEVSLAGKTIPAHGHFVIVDSDAYPIDTNSDDTADDSAAVFGDLPPAESLVLSSVEGEFNHIAYMHEDETVLRLEQYQEVSPGNWDWVPIMVYTLSSAKTGETDGDSLATDLSAQVRDPRPCWLRNGQATLETEPWGAGAWDLALEKTAAYNASYWEWDADTTHALWFNRNWRDDANAATPVNSGDNWYKLDASALDAAPSNADNLLHSFPPVATSSDVGYSGVPGQETRVMNVSHMPSAGWLGFVHAGVDWCTLSLGAPTNAGDFGERELVYLRNLPDYLAEPFSPFENTLDDDGDGVADDNGTQALDRLGPEIRQVGRINVNTAPASVLVAAFSTPWLQNMWTDGSEPDPEVRAAALASYIVTERNNGPFSSVDDLFERVPQLFEVDLVDNATGLPPGDGQPDVGQPNSFRREGLVRFMHNLLTVRTDIWGVLGQVRLLQDGRVIAERPFYFILDRSRDPIRVVEAGTPPQ